MDERTKAIVKQNAVGLMQIGYPFEEALEMAMDQEDFLFPEQMKRLRIPKPGYGAASGRGSGAGGSAIGPGGTHGVGSGY